MADAPSRHLQGPRPPPIRLNTKSRKIRKQQPAAARANHPPPPVVIYVVSPKIIHVDRSEFKSLVQRLTGSNASSSTSTNAPPPPQVFDGGVQTLQPTSTWQFHENIPHDHLYATDFNPYGYSSSPHLHGNVMNPNNFISSSQSQMMSMPYPSIFDHVNSFSHV